MTEIESSLGNVVLKYKQDDILDKDETMFNVQERNNCTNLPSSQTIRSYLHNQYGPAMSPNFRKLERLKIQLAKTSNHLTFLMKCKNHDIVPKVLLLKAPYHTHRSSKIALSPEIGTISVYWTQLSRFYLMTEIESSLRNVVF
jgi:hypothetical protein